MRISYSGRPPSVGGLLVLAFAACAQVADEDSPGLTAAKGSVTANGDPTVDAVDPTAATQDTVLDIRVFGAGYDKGSVAELVLNGVPTDKVVTNSTRFKSPGELIANVTIALDATTDRYDVLVTTSRGKKGIGIEKFEVQPKGKPPSCPDDVSLTVTGLSGALSSDGGGYAAKLVASNGNLYFDLRNTSRKMGVTTSLGSSQQSTRTYTNTHETACGLTAMDPTGSVGSGVLEIEWRDSSHRWILRYGKNCVGEFGTVVPANRIATARSASTWTLTGANGTGLLCRGRLSGKPNWTQVGTASAFTMLLEGSP